MACPATTPTRRRPVRPTDRLDALLADPPSVHTDPTGRVHGDWSLAPEVLRLIAASVRPGGCTLETGLGLSTARFATLAVDHTAITPASPS
jgi:hypothetical protein